jgi:hypothetical protein
MSRPVRRVACGLSSLAAALLLAACGGSSSSPSSASSSSSTATSTSTSSDAHVAAARVQDARKVAPIPKFVGAAARDVHVTATGPVKARPPQPGTIDDEVNASGAKTLNPCTLVSRSEAAAILRKSVGKPVDAPQGPTCIYTPKGAKSLVTLSVEATDFSKVQLQSQLRDRISVKVDGHTAYCGLAGGPTMIVPLSTGRFLVVTAPCPLAASFAAKSLGRISSAS